MVRPSPVPAKENDVPRAPSPLTKKPRPSMNNKRVSFGHVELHTFCKDADRTPSPMPPPAAPLFASAIDGRVETHAVVALRTRATPLPAAQQPHASLAGGPVLIDQAPQLSDLLRGMDEPSGGRAAPFEEDDDDVVFQPRAGGESVTMDFTQAYGGGIREVRTDAQSPAHEPAAVGMEFTRSYGAGILSSGGAEPMDEDEPVDAASLAPSPTPTFDAPTSQPAAGARAEPLTYEQFLANHGIRFLDEIGPPRKSSVAAEGEAELRADGGVAEREQALIVAAACIWPQVESAQWGAEQLAASCAQLRAAIAQTEELVRADAATFFEHIGAASTELHALKAVCRNGALAMWYEWRSKLEVSNAQVLADSQTHLLADKSRLEPLLRAVRDVHARARADPRAAGLSARAADAERRVADVQREAARCEAAIAAASSRAAAARTATAALRATIEPAAGTSSTAALEAEESGLVEKVASLRESCDQLLIATDDSVAVQARGAVEPAADACARAQEHAVLAACLGWKAITLTSSLIELQFAAGVRLCASLMPAADKSALRLRAPPSIERIARGGAEDGIACILADLALCAVSREAAACVSLSALPPLARQLGLLCGRAHELALEICALSVPHEIECAREPAIIGGRPGSAPVLTITFTNSAQRLRFKATLRIDALTVPAAISYQRVDVEQCPAGLSHNSVAKCVIDAMASTERLALLRLTAVCASVHAALSAACGALTR